jgi:hypothetical protein
MRPISVESDAAGAASCSRWNCPEYLSASTKLQKIDEDAISRVEMQSCR